MKVRVEYSISIPDEYRRAINIYYGRPGIASRDEVKAWYRGYGESMDHELAMLMSDEKEGQ